MNDFDPFVYAKDVKAHPENYVSMKRLEREAWLRIAIRRTQTMADLKALFDKHARAAKKAGDADLLASLTEVKNTRKAQLEAV